MSRVLGSLGQLKLRVLLACVVGLTCLSAIAWSQQPDYQSYFVQRLAYLEAHNYSSTTAYTDSGHLQDAAFAAAAEVRAWQITGDVSYANKAVQRLYAIAGSGVTDAAFFSPYPISFAYQQLNSAGLIPADLQKSMKQFAAAAFNTADNDNILFNQTLQRAAGLALAAQIWPDLPEAPGWNTFANTVYNNLAKVQDVPENATNYNTFDLVYVFLLSDVLNRPQLLTLPGIRAMYGRFLNQVSPMGFIAPYGDSGTASSPFSPNWPMTNPWGAYVAAFERAAHLYQDPTLRYGAAAVYQMGAANQGFGTISYVDMLDLFMFSWAVNWQDVTIGSTMAASQSQVLTRADFNAPSAPDKLILAPSRKSNAPFVMTDLYVHGQHGHDNQHGSITYYEYNNTQLLTMLGYNNRNAEEVSLLMMRPAVDTFPHIQGEFVPNQWYQAILPTSRLAVVDPAQPYLRRIDQVTLRIVSQANGVNVEALDFELTGAGQIPIVLDNGQSTSGWSGSPTLVSDAPAGFSKSLLWQTSANNTVFYSKDFSQAFDYRQYPTLSFRWKLSNNDEQARPIIFRVNSTDINGYSNESDYDAWMMQLEPTLQSYATEQADSDQYGALNYTGWFTQDTTLMRQMVLTRSGILVVRDLLTPGPLANGMVGGPIWTLSQISAPTAGPNWFYSAGGPTDLLTYFDSTSGRNYGYQSTNVWSKNNQQTAFENQTLVVGQPAYFVSVLVPETPGTVPATAAAGVTVQNVGTTSTVNVSTPRDTATITISDNGTWSVSRVADDFSVIGTQGAASVIAGAGTSFNVMVTPAGNFSGPVALSVAGLPTGTNASFSPSTITAAGASTMSVMTSASTPAGSYVLTISATNGGMTHTSTVTLTVVQPDFTISASSSQAVVAGTSTTYTASVAPLSGFSGIVTMSVSGLPAGATASFNPPAINGGSGSTTATITTTNSTPGGTYYFTINGTSGGVTRSATVTLTVTQASSLPSDWADLDLGSPGFPGSARFDAGVFTVMGSGSDIYGTADQGHFLYSLTGSGTITARVPTQQNTNSWAKAGVMIRETTAANSAYVFISITPGKGVSMQYRPSTGASAVNLAQVAGSQAPYWVRLARSGNTFTGFSSPDGTTWIQVASIDVTMSPNAMDGLAVTSHDNSQLNTSTFDNVSFSTQPDFGLTVSPASQALTAGGSTSYKATLTPILGFTGTVDLSVSGLPSGASANFNLGGDAGTSTLSIVTSSSTPAGSYTLTVTGTSASLLHTATVTLVVNGGPKNCGFPVAPQ